MEEEQQPKQEVQPTIGEYQGKPILRIPTVYQIPISRGIECHLGRTKRKRL
jgi:hypothetical protein